MSTRPRPRPRALIAAGSPRIVALTVVALACTQVACVTVRPSERQVLSKPEMDPAHDVHEEAFQSHVESAREGAFGGHGAAGGGCGCG